MLFALSTACAGADAKSAPAGCIAPANPGGGWDLTCRMTADAFQSLGLSRDSLRVTNMPGRGGAVAFATVATTMVGNDGVIVAASPSTVLGLVQHQYGALSERDVRWIAAVGAEPSVIAVRADAPWRSLQAFVADWRAHPDSITIVGASVIGGQDHMKMLVVARAIGLDVRRVRYLPSAGSIDAIDAVVAGTAQVFPGDVSEVRRAVGEKKLRVLAVLGGVREPGVLANVPTAREQGVPVTWAVWRGFYAPRGITEAGYARWVDRLTRMTASPTWKAALAHNGLRPFFLAGKPFDEFLRQQTDADRTLSRDIGLIK